MNRTRHGGVVFAGSSYVDGLPTHALYLPFLGGEVGLVILPGGLQATHRVLTYPLRSLQETMRWCYWPQHHLGDSTLWSPNAKPWIVKPEDGFGIEAKSFARGSAEYIA